MEAIDPVAYARTRNFGNVAVSYLSPYISRGAVSTRKVFEYLVQNETNLDAAEKFIQELAWRDYWQLVWNARGDEIFQDLKSEQHPVASVGIPTAILEANTGIGIIDSALKQFYQTGYLHNHIRMYIAAISCNIAQCHWLEPARWMYAHLWDGDLASNHLSWQWVAGTFSKKKYYANQENVNKYFGGSETGTFLDVSYEEIVKLPIPNVLKETSKFELKTELPELPEATLVHGKPTLVYNYYNIDAEWHRREDFQRVLLLEPSHFESHPISQSALNFALELAQNIPEIQIVVNSFEALEKQVGAASIRYKQHPLNAHYLGTEEPRDWLSSVHGFYPSFFAFWKKCKKELWA